MDYLNIDNLSKSYGNIAALSGINFNIRQGEKVALLGSNGAGKSTLVNICTGLRRADYGEAKLFGKTPFEIAIKKKFSILPQTLQFPKGLKCKEVIDLVASHYENPNTSELVAKLDVSNLLNKYTSNLSGGEKRRIAFLLTFLGEPDLVFLDEPTANIDIENKEIIYEFLKDYYSKDHRSLLFTSHQMNEVEKVAERLIVLHQGKVILDSPVHEVKNSFSLRSVSFKAKNDPAEFTNCEKLVKQGDTYTVYCSDTDQAVKELCDMNIDFKNLVIKKSNLEEIVLNMWRKNRDSA